MSRYEFTQNMNYIYACRKIVLKTFNKKKEEARMTMNEQYNNYCSFLFYTYPKIKLTFFMRIMRALCNNHNNTLQKCNLT